MGVSLCDGEAMRRRGRILTEWSGEVDEKTGRKVDVGLRVYRAKQVSMSQPGRCQGFGEATTQIVVFRAIELKPLPPVQLACNREAFSISI